jgi:hypothetical protein
MPVRIETPLADSNMATTAMTANPITVSISAKENEWVAPQFHRKVHVNNRIYIEGAGIEKLGYERLTEFFSQWGPVFNVELKVNNRDGRRQKKVYGFVTFQEEGDAQACIESAKAGIEIEPGRPLSVRSAFFMPRRNSFDTEKSGGSQQNWHGASQQPNVPTIHDSRSPSPNNPSSAFPTGEWKNEMATQNGSNGHPMSNGGQPKQITVEEQAKKLFEIFQSLPDNAKDKILQILNAQKYQEEQLRAIKEIRFDDNQNGPNQSGVPSNLNGGSNGDNISSMFQQVSLNEDKRNLYQSSSSISRMNGHAVTSTTGSRDFPSDPLSSSGFSKGAPPSMPLMPRYPDSNGFPRASQPSNGLYNGQSGSPALGSGGPRGGMESGPRATSYSRQYSEPISSNNNFESFSSNGFDMPKSSARPIPQKLRNDNALSLDLPESFGPSSPGVWQMPNSPPDNYFPSSTRNNATRNDDFPNYS